MIELRRLLRLVEAAPTQAARVVTLQRSLAALSAAKAGGMFSRPARPGQTVFNRLRLRIANHVTPSAAVSQIRRPPLTELATDAPDDVGMVAAVLCDTLKREHAPPRHLSSLKLSPNRGFTSPQLLRQRADWQVLCVPHEVRVLALRPARHRQLP